MENKMEFLKQHGMDMESALSYLGDYETIDEIVKDFYDGLDEQLKQLEDLKNSADMTNYAIYVHALKSNYRSLGLKAYAETAYEHEMQSKANNAQYVNDNFLNLINDKEKIKKVIEEYKGL